MKKLFTSLILLTAAVLFGGGNLWAETYGLKIAGVQVTSDNASNITGTGISGTVKYDSESKVLRLINATITATGADDDAIYNSGIDNLQIWIDGTVTLNCSATSDICAGIYCIKNTKITHSNNIYTDKLIINNTGAGSAIFCQGDIALTFIHTKATLTAANNHAIQARTGYSSTSIAMQGAEMTLKSGSGKYGIYGFKGGLNYTYSGFATCELSSSFDATTGNVAQSTVYVYPTLKIGNQPIIDGARTINASTTGATSLSGSISFNLSTKTLTLNNLQMEGAGIITRVPDLTIETAGTSSIKYSSDVCQIRENTKFTGSGSLSLTSTGASAISTFLYKNVTVEMAGLSCQGKKYGFWGQNHGELILNRRASTSCTYKFAGETANVLTGTLTMNDMDIWTTTQWYNDEENLMYRYDEVAKTSDIESQGSWFCSTDKFTYYGLTVFGKKVHGQNKSIIHYQVPEITAGTLVYDNTTSTLTMTGMTASSTSDEANGVAITAANDITINVSGTNTINTSRGALICYGNTKLTSSLVSDKLTINSTKNAITQWNGKTFTIDCAKLCAYSDDGYGFSGSNTATLAINKNASFQPDIYFKGKAAAIGGTASLTLTDMDFYSFSPDGTPGCYFDASKKAVCQNGGAIVNDDKVVNFYTVIDKYGIYVAGVQVTNCNMGGIGSPAITAGGGKAVAYNNVSKILELSNATIDYTPSDANVGVIQTDAGAELAIQVTGNNTVTSTNAYTAMWLRQSGVNITGSGTLNLSGKGSDLYPMQQTALTIRDNVTVNAMNKGIVSNNAAQSLTISENAVVKATEIYGMGSIILNDGQAVAAPNGATISSGAVKVGSSNAKNVVIMKVENYGLQVADIDVTSYNKGDILGDGHFSYDSSSKTLTIQNANVESTTVNDLVRNVSVDGLTINIQGNNTAKVRDNIFRLHQNTRIIGTGTLNGELSKSDGFGIFGNSGEVNSFNSLQIDGPTMTIKGQMFIGGARYCDVVINSGKIVYTPNADADACALGNMKSFTLGAGMMITEPVGGYYDTTNNSLYLNGAVYRGSMVIDGVTGYDLYVAGVQAHSGNCNDILGNGVFNYDDASKTLTINGTYHNTADDHVITSSISDLTIKVAGQSKLTTTSNSSMIRLDATTTITGDKLTLRSLHSLENNIGIYLTVGTLTIKDADLDLSEKGFLYAITGLNSCQLVIDNSDIVAAAYGQGVIYEWGGITLNNCYVDTPRPSQILSYGIADANGTIVGSGSELETVVIRRGADAIEGIDVAERTVTETYDVAGRRLNKAQRGINIVRTSDGKTHKVLKK